MAAARVWIPRLARVAVLLPVVALAAGAATGRLGADPAETLLHETGQWALRLLLASLAVTPLRRLAGLSLLAPLRRTFGLAAFGYAALHASVYATLEAGLDPGLLAEDLAERPYITAGAGALAILTVLAVTSTRGWKRRLGRRWVRLHRLAYLAAGLGVLHFLWLVKADLREPLVYASVLALLLGARLLRPGGAPARRRRPRARQPRHNSL